MKMIHLNCMLKNEAVNAHRSYEHYSNSSKIKPEKELQRS